jgi:hypothetical protein
MATWTPVRFRDDEPMRSGSGARVRSGGRHPATWSPGEVLAIDWGGEVVAGRKVHAFCAVLAWSRFRFVHHQPQVWHEARRLETRALVVPPTGFEPALPP